MLETPVKDNVISPPSFSSIESVSVLVSRLQRDISTDWFLTGRCELSKET